MPAAFRTKDRITSKTFQSYADSPVGVATLHECMNRTGLMRPHMRPIQQGARVVGRAVTVSVPPGDNWMIHVAVELCQPGDILVVAPTSDCDMGYFGDVLASALQTRGGVGLIIDAGVRDVLSLRQMQFPVWSRCISAEGTVKETLRDVNIPLVCAGVLVRPQDLVVADDDGIVVIPPELADNVLASAIEREIKEEAIKERLAKGELTLDIYDMRPALEAKGLRYFD